MREPDLDLGELPPHRPDPAPRRRPVRLVAVLAVLLVLGLALTYADRRLRAVERERLAACEAAARAAVERADLVLGSMEEYLRPVLAVDPDVLPRESFYALLAEEAAEVAPRLDEARRGCAGVGVVALHGALRAERDAYVAYLATRHDWLRAVADDGSRYLDPPEDLGELRRAAFG